MKIHLFYGYYFTAINKLCKVFQEGFAQDPQIQGIKVQMKLLMAEDPHLR